MKDSLELYEELKKKYTKYRIAKVTGLSYATLTFWDKGVFFPNKESGEKLRKMLEENY